jgi:hypothetical protein
MLLVVHVGSFLRLPMQSQMVMVQCSEGYHYKHKCRVTKRTHPLVSACVGAKKIAATRVQTCVQIELPKFSAPMLGIRHWVDPTPAILVALFDCDRRKSMPTWSQIKLLSHRHG